MSAIVKDDWTNCEKNIKHLKNQKDIGFIALVVLENIEINEFGEKNIFWIIFVAQICTKLSKNDENWPNFALHFFLCVLNLLNLGDKKIVTYMSWGFLTF